MSIDEIRRQHYEGVGIEKGMEKGVLKVKINNKKQQGTACFLIAIPCLECVNYIC